MFEASNELCTLAKKVIDKYPEFENLKNAIDTGKLCITCLKSDRPKRSGRKIIYADCEKVSDKLRAVSDIDFIITFYGDSEDMTEHQRELLMLHELKHVGYKNGRRSIVPHDLEDFRDIIDEYGVDWNLRDARKEE